MSTEQDRRYEAMHPVQAVVAAWTAPGIEAVMHTSVRREIRRLSPALSRNLDRLAAEDVTDRAAATALATESVAGSLLALYGRSIPDGHGGAVLADGHTDDERWRRATVIVNELVRVGLI